MKNSNAIAMNARPRCAKPGCKALACNKGRRPNGERRYGRHCHHHSHHGRSVGGQSKIDNSTCQRCGWNKAPCDRHRINPVEGYVPENVLILCPNCHRLEELRLKKSAVQARNEEAKV